MSRSAGILYTRFFLSGSNFHLGFNFFEVLLSYHFTLTIFTDRGADAEKVQEHAGGWGRTIKGAQQDFAAKTLDLCAAF